MPSMQLRRDEVIVGVDTHKDNHVAVAIDGFGGRLGCNKFPMPRFGRHVPVGIGHRIELERFGQLTAIERQAQTGLINFPRPHRPTFDQR